jgi:hypothetical protein
MSEDLRCPDTERYPGDIVGCGSTNLAGPDDEGIYDCRDCGVFFDPATANDPMEGPE